MTASWYCLWVFPSKWEKWLDSLNYMCEVVDCYAPRILWSSAQMVLGLNLLLRRTALIHICITEYRKVTQTLVLSIKYPSMTLSLMPPSTRCRKYQKPPLCLCETSWPILWQEYAFNLKELDYEVHYKIVSFMKLILIECKHLVLVNWHFSSIMVKFDECRCPVFSTFPSFI